MTYHTPIMSKEILELLNIDDSSVIIDGTLGDGGHTELFLQKVAPLGHVYGIDQNKESRKRAEERLKKYKHSLTILAGNFKYIDTILPKDVESVDAILLDLGWSSSQLNDEQGLSFMKDGPLDMRLNDSLEVTAADILDKEKESSLGQIFRQLGGERYWRKIAHAIVEHRRKKRITRVSELVAIIEKEMSHVPRGTIHPATRVFQALRIAVNDELDNLKEVIPKLVALLKPGGRIAILTFHSLEDKIVKLQFARNESLEVVTPKPLAPSDEEIKQNPRSRSAKLRVAQKK